MGKEINMLKNRKGEVVTLVIIGSLIVITLATLVATTFLKKKQTTSTEASGTVASSSCIQTVNGNEYIFFKRSDASPVCDTNSIQAGPQNDAWLVGNGPCADNNACGNGKWCYYFDNQYRKSRCLTRDPSCDNGRCLENKGGSSTPPSQSPNLGGFHLTAEIYGEKGVGEVKFNVHVKFNSDGCDGDINLFRDGVHVAGTNGWNRQLGPFEYDEKWAGSFTLQKGQSITLNYRGTVDRCPASSTTLEDTIQCTLFVDSNGNPAVSGSDCFSKNFTNPAPKPTAMPTASTSTRPPSPSLPSQQPTNTSTPISTPPSGATNTPMSTNTPIPNLTQTAPSGQAIPPPVQRPITTSEPLHIPVSTRFSQNDIVNLKGEIRIRIPITGSEYLKYLHDNVIKDRFDIILKKTNDCGFLGFGCRLPLFSPSFKINKEENDITFSFPEVKRYFKDNGEVKQVEYYLKVDFMGENLFEDNDLVFDGFNATLLEKSTAEINFANYIRIANFSFKKLNNYIYSNIVVSNWKPPISNYIIDETVYPYSYMDFFSLKIDKSFSLVYDSISQGELPLEITFYISYFCSNKPEGPTEKPEIKSKRMKINISKLDSLGSQQEIPLSCDPNQVVINF